MPSSEQHFGVCPYLDASVYQLWVWIADAFYEYLKYLTAQSKLTNFMELSHSSEAATCVATQELPAIYGTERCITMFTTALHWSLSSTRSIQSVTTHPM
jgi:hypothetical protein